MNKLPSASEKFMNWVRSKYDAVMGDADELALLKTEDLLAYKEAIWRKFDVISHSEYTEIYSETDGWFSGSSLNYAEHIFRKKTDEKPAILFLTKSGENVEISWQELVTQTTSFADYLQYLKVKPGDIVVGITADVPEQIMAFLACNAIGAIWANLSPQTEEKDLINAFQQLEPKVLIASENYNQAEKQVNNVLKINNLIKSLPAIKQIIVLPSLPPLQDTELITNGKYWNDTFSMAAPKLTFEALPFQHPLFITFEQNDSPLPTPIKHQQGEMLLDRFARLRLEQKLKEEDKILPFYGIAAPLLLGATLVLSESEIDADSLTGLDIGKAVQ